MHRIVTIFCKYMNHNVTYPVLSKSVSVEGVFFVSNTAYAYSICKSVDNKLVCETSPDEVCTFYGPNSVVCETRNSPTIPSG
jgi:hypothetical protein